MTLVLTNDAKRYFLNGKISNPEGTQVVVHLYTNNHAPLATDTLAAYNEASAPWYSPLGLTLPATPFINGSGYAEVDGPALQWTPTTTTTPQTIYGFYVTSNTGGILLFAELNPAGPVTIGDTLIPYVIVPAFLEGQQA